MRDYIQPRLVCGFCGLPGHSAKYCRNTPHCPKCGGPHIGSACKVDRVRGMEECNDGEGMEDEDHKVRQPPRVKQRGNAG